MKSMITKLILFCLLGTIININLIGQDLNRSKTEVGLKKNSVYGSFGYFHIPYFAFNGNYERMIYDFHSRVINSVWLRVGGGLWQAWAAEGPYLVTGCTLLAFEGNSHLELNIGVTSRFNKLGYDLGVGNAIYQGRPIPTKSDYRYFEAAGAFGYRFQQPGGSFLFRIGISWPETAYVSLGVCF